MRRRLPPDRRLYIPKTPRRALEDYLQTQRHPDDRGVPLFVATRSGGYLLRDDLPVALKRIGQEASKHRATSLPPIRLRPHRLRHTFGARHREHSNDDSDTAAALGNRSTKYVGRYARKTDDEREAMIEDALDR